MNKAIAASYEVQRQAVFPFLPRLRDLDGVVVHPADSTQQTETAMINIRNISKAASTIVLLAAASLFGAGAALADECPVGKTGMDVTKPGPMTPSGVTDTVISNIDLKAYGSAGHQLRMRRLVVQPGGIVPWHSHAERPANILVVSGSITEYRSTCAT